jgi:hypothetical protein
MLSTTLSTTGWAYRAGVGFRQTQALAEAKRKAEEEEYLADPQG